jgi:hypothetical protein
LTLRCAWCLQLVHLGVKMFDKCSRDRSGCDYRLTQDGLAFVLPYMRKRVVGVTREQFVGMIERGTMELDELDQEARQQVEALELGSFVFTIADQASQGE